MRRMICLISVLVLCLSLAAPVFATESGFVPSITYKPNPEITPVVGDDGGEYIGTILDKDGNVLDYVDHGCLMVTPIAHIWDEENKVPQEVEELLTSLYDALNDNSMKVPYDKHGADLDPANMVIRDLFDARWACDEHREMIEAEGVVFEITFDLGVVADAQIYAMTYDEAAQEWNPVVSIVNNGDGTVTCTFEHLCAVEFSMPIAAAAAPAEAVQKPNATPWIVTLLLAAAGAVGVVVGKNKKKSAV